MADGEQWLTPADTVRTRLRQLSAADVKKLAPGATNADAILAALQSVGNASYEDDSDLLHAAVPHAWRLTIDVERNASFRELSAEEAATAFAGLDLGKVSGWGWSDFVDTFEEAIDNLASEAKDIALNFDVQKAVEVGLEIALSLTVGGHLWTTAGKAETFEEAAEVASAILSAAEAKFEDLVDFFGWLLDEAKDDIWRTKNAIHDLFRQAPDELIKLVQDASAVSASFFAAQEQWLDSQFQTLIDQIGQEPLDPPALAAGAEGTPISYALDEWDAAASWLWDQILGQADGLTKDFAFSTDLINKISNFIQELGTDCVDKVQARMDSFLQALDSYASNAENLETLLLKTLLELVKDVLLAILDLVDTVTHDFLSLIQLVLQAVGEVFDAPIGGVLQDLFDLMNTGAEETATVAGFAALMLAAPATVVYRAVEGAAPFSEELATADAQPSTWLILAGCATASLWAPMDAYLDFRVLPETGPGPLDKLVNVCGANLIPIGLQLMCWPKGPFTPPVLNTVQDKADWAAWGCGWGPMGFNLMVTVYRRLAGTARGKQWAWMLALLGFVATGANIIKVGKETIDGNTNAYDWILAFSAPLPVMAKPLAFVPGWGQTLLLLCDFVGDGATAVARIQKGEAMHDV